MPVFRNVKSRQLVGLNKGQVVNYDGNVWDATLQAHGDRGAALTIPQSPRSSSTPSPAPQGISCGGHRGGRRNKPGYIPRPRNAFIFFRSSFYAEQKLCSTEIDQNDISRRAGKCWKSLSNEEKRPFKLLAEKEKLQHQTMYPDYSYAPGIRKGKSKPKSQPQQPSSIAPAEVVAPPPVKTESPWSFPWDGKDTSCYAPESRQIAPRFEGGRGVVGNDFAGQGLLHSGFVFPEMPANFIQERNNLLGYTPGPGYHGINPQLGGQPIHNTQDTVELAPHLPVSDAASVHGDWDFISQTLASYPDFTIENSWLDTISDAELGSLFPSNPGLFDEVPPLNIEGEGDIFQFLNFM